jgi:hypothetical protein
MKKGKLQREEKGRNLLNKFQLPSLAITQGNLKQPLIQKVVRRSDFTSLADFELYYTTTVVDSKIYSIKIT